MKIELEFPFNKDWKFGYVVTNKEPRRNVILFNKENDRSTVSYARYLMSVKLKRYLTRKEVVDHIDNDRLNDVIGNLQILTPAENTRKSAKPATLYEYICPVCGDDFVLPKNQTYNKLFPTCSRKCGRKMAVFTFRYNRGLKD